MGGDVGPQVAIEGAALALRELRHSSFLFHGREAEITPILDNFPDLKKVSRVLHCDNVISMEEKPSQALRKGRGNSSMWMALQSVKDGEADVVISGGNTGALMAMATFCLRPMEGISRPAIAAIWPTLRADIIVLDVGATIGGDAKQLVDFSILGAALARALFDMEAPSIGLLNVGTEDMKGHEEVREAAAMLTSGSGAGFTYHGFVEGDDIGKGTVDVIVTEGFTGNIALKTAEGTARFISTLMKDALTAGPMSRLGALLALPALRRMRQRIDPSAINGGPLLGLNGIVVKSHGGADARGFGNAIRIAVELARSDYLAKVGHSLNRLTAVLEQPPASTPDAAMETSQ